MEELKLINKESFDKGVLLLENGKYIFIEEIQYTYDGTFWENEFKADIHKDPRDLTETIPGHRYRRVRHAGDTNFQEPEYIVAEDGKDINIVSIEGVLYSYKEGDSFSDYKELFKLNTLEGSKGDRGEKGEGWHVDSIGYYLEKPSCPSTTTTTCNSCSGNTTEVTKNILFLSLGDGLYEIQASDIGGYYSNDGDIWVEITATDEGSLVRYTADDNIGTGQVDYRDENTLNTRGKVYVCSDGRWVEFISVAIPRHKLSPTESYYISYQEGLYMEDYMAPLYTSVPDDGGTVVMNQNGSEYKLGIKMNSVEPKHLKDDSFGDGFNEGVVGPNGYKESVIMIDPDSFVGYGLDVYTSDTDGYTDIQVKPSDYIKDGLKIVTNLLDLNGEDREELFVDVNDLVDVSLSGLDVFENTDGFDDIRVKTGVGLNIDTSGLYVMVDEVSIEIDDSDAISIKEYNSGNDGVLTAHLNPDVVNTNRAIDLDTTGLEVTLTDDHNPFAFDADGILIKNEGVQGWHLNTNVADETKGVELNTTSDMLEAKIKPGGGLDVDSYGLKIDANDFSWLDDYVVKKIEVGGIDYSGDLVIEGDTSSDTYMNIEVSAVGQTITITPDTQLGNLENLIEGIINGTPIDAHTHTIGDITGLQTVLDTKIKEDTRYGNIKIGNFGSSSQGLPGLSGLFIQNPSGDWGRLVAVDDDFNLGVEPV